MIARLILSCIVALLGAVGSARAESWIPSDFSGVQWLYADVSKWPQTATLSVRTGSTTITLNHSKANTWPGVWAPSSNGSGMIQLNANAWIFVKRNGTWYAATFEWLQVGQTTKNIETVKGDHIKVPPLNTFVPVHGEVYGFMVSGLARDAKRNIQERSEVKMYRWGVGPVPMCTTPPTIQAFSASTDTVARDEAATLTWQVADASKVSISPLVGQVVNPVQGTQQVTVADTTEFTLRAENECGVTNATKTISLRNVSVPVIMQLLGEKEQQPVE